MATIGELWRSGVRLIRRDPWSDGSYIELLPSGLDSRYHTPFGKIHSPLEWAGVPDDIRLDPQDIPLWTMPEDEWEAYSGPTDSAASAPAPGGPSNG